MIDKLFPHKAHIVPFSLLIGCSWPYAGTYDPNLQLVNGSLGFYGLYVGQNGISDRLYTSLLSTYRLFAAGEVVSEGPKIELP